MPSGLQITPLRKDGLQLAEDRVFQNRFWTVQRIAWVLFGIFLLIALAGFTGGGGYFSHQSVRIGGATATLPLVARWADNEHVRVEAVNSSATAITLGNNFNDYFSIEQIHPSPEKSEATPSGLRLLFAASGEGKKTINIGVRASRPGWTSFDIGVDGTTSSASVLILP